MKIIGYTRNDESVFEVCRKANGEIIKNQIFDCPVWVSAVNANHPAMFDLVWEANRRRDGNLVKAIETGQLPMSVLASPFKVKRWFLDRGIWPDHIPAVIRYLRSNILEIEGGKQNGNN